MSSLLNLEGARRTEATKIALINPPSGFLIDQRVFLPLGLATIAAVARDQGHSVNLLDLSDAADYESQALQKIRESGADVVGITATSPQFHYAYKIMERMRAEIPRVKTIIGGSHASMFSALRNSVIRRFNTNGLTDADISQLLANEDVNFRRLEDFDVIAAGEERSLDEALRALQTGQKWVDGGVSSDLDGLPLPARDLFNFRTYLFNADGSPKFKLNGNPTGSVISQRGCPFLCEFCCGRKSLMYHQVKLPGGVLRAHSPERIVRELNSMREQFGLENFMFYDDEFNLSPERTINLCKALQGRGYSFRGFVKSDLLVKNPEVAYAMKAAGFVEVLSGVESGSERILERHLHKKTSPDINRQAASICLDAGLRYKALTMVGHTSETVEDVMATRDWLMDVGRRFKEARGPGHFTFDLTVFQPYAGCPIWDKAERNNGEFSDQYPWVYFSRRRGDIVDPDQGGIYLIKPDFSKDVAFYKGKPGEYKAFVRTRSIDAEKYASLRDEIEYQVRNELGMPQLLPSAENQHDHAMGQS